MGFSRFFRSISILICSISFVFATFFEGACNGESASGERHGKRVDEYAGNMEEEKTSGLDSFEVVVGFLPADVNPDALLKPHALSLAISGEKSSQALIMRGYPVRKKIVWSPETGRDVVLKVSIGDLELEKKYSGRFGFPEFLKEFEGGWRVFRAEEFGSEESRLLKEYRVEFVRVAFLIRGAEPVIRFLEK